MFLLGFRRMLTSLALCKSIESAIQLFQIHNRITFATIPNSAVYLSGARVSTFSTLVPRLPCLDAKCVECYHRPCRYWINIKHTSLFTARIRIVWKEIIDTVYDIMYDQHSNAPAHLEKSQSWMHLWSKIFRILELITYFSNIFHLNLPFV